MGKYKVGDKVRVRKDLKANESYGNETFMPEMKKFKGKKVTIAKVHGNRYYIREDKNKWNYTDEMLERVEYTYEDLKKSPVGTKITFENGDILIKLEEDSYESRTSYRNNENLKGLKDNINLGKIIKIEEPEYQTVYESKPEILDEVEKRYLRGVIRPFKENVRFITKRRYWIDSTEYNDISICIRNNSNIILPKFIANKMYKGMEMEKTYTLEELGL